MTHSKHTPGPWSADKWATGFTVSAPNSHYSVCHLEDCNNAENNARLIAAAPEMLEALRGWRIAFPDAALKAIHDIVGRDTCKHLDAALAKIDTAIAKAEGK